MKKLMIAAAIVCAAVVSQAATAEWTLKTSGTGASQVWYDNSTTAKLAENTMVYLFDAAVTSQDDILTALRGNTKSSLADFTSVNSTVINGDSKMTAITEAFGYGLKPTETQTYSYNFFLAAMDEAGNVLLLDDKSFSSSGLAEPGTISFSGIKDSTQKSWTSDATFTFAGDGGKGAGWYAVPEPTSGLLLLLGVAGLALRRRRA